jgi:sugar-specific transcriptional regulator TrmB
MNDPTRTIARSLGLSTYEAKLYVAGLGNIGRTIAELSRLAHIPRTAAYLPLKSLVEQGLATSIKKGRRLYYRSLEPQNLKNILHRRLVDLEEATAALAPTITSQSGDLSVRYYEGRDGLLSASDIFLQESPQGSTWKTFENPAGTVAATGLPQLKDYIGRRVDKKIDAKVILPGNLTGQWFEETNKRNAEELREVLMISPDQYPIDAVLAVGEDSVIVGVTKPTPFAVIIKNKSLAATLSSVHDIVWDRYRR